MERDAQGGSDVGRDHRARPRRRAAGDAPRRAAGLPRADRRSRAGQRPLAGAASRRRRRPIRPNRTGTRAQDLLYPAFRPVGTQGLALDSIDRDDARRPRREEPRPAAPRRGSGGAAGRLHASTPAPSTSSSTATTSCRGASSRPTIQDAAMRNLAAWSATAPWTDEVSGDRRLISSRHGRRLGCRADPAAGGRRAPRRGARRASGGSSSACPSVTC